MRLERHPSHDLQTGGALPRAATLCHAPSRAGGLPTRVSMAGTVLRFSGSIRAKSRPIAPNRAQSRPIAPNCATWDMLAQIESSSTKALSRRWATAGRGGMCQLDNTSHSYAGRRYEPVLWATSRKSPLVAWACMEVRTRPCCRSESPRISFERHPSHDLQTGEALPSRWRGLFMTRKSAGLVRP